MLVGAFCLALAALDLSDGARHGGARPPGPSRFSPSAATTADGKPIRASSLGSSDYCGACHRDIFQQWAASAHHFSSFNNPFYRRVALDTARRSGGETLRWCAGCHDPIPLLAGEVGSGDLEGWAANAGITCLVCHRVAEVSGGNGGYVLDAPGFRSLTASEHPFVRGLHDGLIRVAPWLHRAALSRPVSRSSEFCGACHAQTIPGAINGARPFSVQNDYAQWRASRFSEHAGPDRPGRPAGCAGCHMPLVPSDDPAAKNGRIRSHRFAAANTALPSLNRDDEQLAAVEAFLADRPLAVELSGLRRNGGPRRALPGERAQVGRGELVELEVTVSSRRVGHTFPGGTVAFNEAWIELDAVDGRRRPVFHSGRVADDGEVDPGAVFYRAVFADRHGRPTDERNASSAAAALDSARLIPAGGVDVVLYRFAVPRDAASPLTVTARLNWRKFSARFARWAFEGRPAPRLPVTVVAEASRRFAVGSGASGRPPARSHQ